MTTEPVKDEILDSIMGRISTGAPAHPQCKVMIFGPPGSGKTTLLAQAPKPLIVDVEKGTLPLSSHPDLVKMSEVKFLEYRSFFQVNELTKRMLMGVKELEDIETLFIDSGSELAKRGLAEIVKRGFDEGIRKSQFLSKPEEDSAENNEQIRQMFSSWRDLNRHIVVTSHHRVNESKTAPTTITPDFSPKLASSINGIMDLVGYMWAEEKDDGTEVRYLRTRTDGTVQAKTRLSELPTVIENPTWDIIWSAFQKQIEIDA